MGILGATFLLWIPGNADQLLLNMSDWFMWCLFGLALCWAIASLWLCIAFKRIGLTSFGVALSILLYQWVQAYGYASIEEHPLFASGVILTLALGLAGNILIVYKAVGMYWRTHRRVLGSKRNPEMITK